MIDIPTEGLQQQRSAFLLITAEQPIQRFRRTDLNPEAASDASAPMETVPFKATCLVSRL